jgi:asparagine synthase (glutamine-hydrolysing)
MCGILWAIYRQNIDRNDLDIFQKSLQKITSRGPDYIWSYQDRNILLWHTRLAIIDTSSAANQPFQIGDCVVVFNGEIYNFQTLQEILKQKWYVFTTTSDTEVLLYAYQERGEECVQYFDGMWAFAIYDKNKQKIFLSRDRIGEKPLLYYHDHNAFIFWSELPAVVWLLDTKAVVIDKFALSNFALYNFKHIPSPYTAFQSICKLDPGYNLSFDIQTHDSKKYKYLQINKIDIQTDPIQQCHDLLYNAVQQTCFADVPVGIFLSGGVDSSLIAAMMKDRNIMTYSLWYDEHDEELLRATKIASHLWLQNKQIYFKEYFNKVALFDTLKQIIKQYGEPVNLMQIIYADTILKEMRQDGIKVAVWWNGADEMFYGYDGMNTLAFASKIKQMLDTIWIGKILPNNHLKKFLYNNSLSKISHIQSKYKKFMYADIFENIANELSSHTLIDIFSWLWLRIENEHSITIVNDIAGSINGMELRTPFLNKNILDFAASLDQSYKVRSYRDKKENKYILKKVLEKYLPHELIYLPKMWFGYNIRYEDSIFNIQNKQEIDYYFDTVLPQIDLYHTDEIKKILEAYRKWQKVHFYALLNIMITCIWYDQQFIHTS